ncbi:UNVERIFIED_CONTAM: T/G mismatch-specific endonuclease [Williamsia faeni]
MGAVNEQSGSSWRPPPSSVAVQARMARQRQRDTDAETQVRKYLHANGIRFRVDAKLEPDLRTKGDIVWRGLKLVVFIDGCFWHGCPEHATRPKANARWWAEKLDANIARDRKTDAELARRGWSVLRFWEHELPEDVAQSIAARLEALRGES